MDVFDYAMKMEMDGKAYYEEHAAKTELPELRQILLTLAADEQRHYEIFKALKEGKETVFPAESETRVLTDVRNVFERLRAQGGDFQFGSEVIDVWKKAQQVEKESEDFYRGKAAEVDSDLKKNMLHRIADEEHKHWATIENVIRFLNRPKSWLEDAEWYDIEKA
jgi:rubrerythrin